MKKLDIEKEVKNRVKGNQIWIARFFNGIQNIFFAHSALKHALDETIEQGENDEDETAPKDNL